MPDYKEETSARPSEQEAPGALPTEDLVASLAVDQLKACQDFKKPRTAKWKENEDAYIGKVKPALRGRFNIPIPIVPGFVDTVLAELREKPVIGFTATKNSDPMRAKKVTAAWEIDSDTQHANWPKKNADSKKIAMIYGFSAFKVYSYSKPEYKHCLDLIDPYDFIFEPLGGSDLEKHSFTGQDNIFRSAYELKDNEDYDQAQVQKLVAAVEQLDASANRGKNEVEKVNRFAALGLNGTFAGFRGDQVYRMAELVLTFKGQRWYVFFNPETGVWVRCCLLKEVYESNLWPYVAYHPYRDPFNFLSKAPVDDVLPAAESARILLGQILDNNQRRNLGQRGYDPEIITDPSQLEWRPDGLVEMKASSKGIPIQNGIFEFTTPEITGSLNLLTWLDNFVGQKTGATASAQGATNKDAKVGVYFGDLRQVAKRMSLQSDSYSEMLEQMGLRYSWCLWEHIGQDFAVKILGEEGADWVDLSKEDASPNFGIRITGGLAELQNNELETERRVQILDGMMADPILSQTLNAAWVAEQKLLAAGFKPEDIRRGLDKTSDITTENDRANAAQAIEDILHKKMPKQYLSAGRAFLQKLLDFYSNTELDPTIGNHIVSYFQQMSTIVAANAARQAMSEGIKAAKDMVMQAPLEQGEPQAVATMAEPMTSNSGPQST